LEKYFVDDQQWGFNFNIRPRICFKILVIAFMFLKDHQDKVQQYGEFDKEKITLRESLKF